MDFFNRYESSLCLKENIKNIDDSVTTDKWRLDKVPKQLLIKSAKETKSQGSSTCTILMLDKNTGKLYSSYIGDSLFLIARKDYNIYKIIYKSKEQMHDYLSPYQIGTGGDKSEDALEYSINLELNDIVIVASDG